MSADIVKLFTPPTRRQQLNSEIMLLEELGEQIRQEKDKYDKAVLEIKNMRLSLNINAEIVLEQYHKALDQREELWEQESRGVR